LTAWLKANLPCGGGGSHKIWGWSYRYSDKGPQTIGAREQKFMVARQVIWCVDQCLMAIETNNRKFFSEKLRSSETGLDGAY